MYHRHRSGPGGPVSCRHSVEGDLVFSALELETVPASPGAPPAGLSAPLSPPEAARTLAALYFASLFRLSWGLTRARRLHSSEKSFDQPRTALGLSFLPWVPLVLLGPAEYTIDRESATASYPVVGGFLSRPPAAGALEFEAAHAQGRLTLTVRVRGFSSRLAGDCSSRSRLALYHTTQWVLHRMLVTRFLRRAARGLGRDTD